jgi:putative selenium metabolism protein SsnA
MNLLIHNITLFTNDAQNAIFRNHAVAVEGSMIKEIGTESGLRKKYPGFKQVNGGGRLLMPGLINAHMHFYSTFARGLALKGTPKNFHEILKMLWWKLDSSLDLDAVYYSALIPAITAVKKGVTAVIDHHASPRAVDGSLDRIEEALSQAGLRGILCYEVSDRDGKEIGQKGLRENERYIQRCRAEKQKNPAHPFDAMIGLHASFTLDDDTLQQAAELSRTLQRGCHIHVLEDAVDRRITDEKYAAEIIERLQRFGILGKNSIAAHGIHLTETEKDIIARTDTIVAHNPQSNMNNAVGRTDIFGLLKRGILVGIGSDGMTADLRPDVRTANLLHKHDLKNSNRGWEEIQQLTFKNNPEIYCRVSGQPVGRIVPGYLADMILVDYYPPTPLTGENFWGHFLFGITDAPVDTTIINGDIVMENKQLPHIDEQKIAVEATRAAEKVWTRFYNGA